MCIKLISCISDQPGRDIIIAMKQKEKLSDRSIGVHALEGVVSKFFSSTEVSKSCRCNICLERYQHREKGLNFLRQTNSMFKIDIDKMKKFYHLLSAVDHKVFFKMQMPELVFFEGGQGKLLFKTKGQAFISVNISAEMRKQIPNIFVDNKRSGNGPVINTENQVHIKYFDTVVPSYKHGLSNDNLENKPQHYTFHSDQREGEENILYSKTQHNPDHEVAIVKYKEKSLQLLTEKQLRVLLKSPHKTANIELIQAFVKPHDRQSEFIFSEYLDYLKPLNALMFSRSLIQMKTQIGLISRYSKDYIPMELLQQYEQMLKEMPEEYCLYQTYKMVHYIQINRELKVKRLNTVWFKDQHKEMNFFGVMQFFYQENEKVAGDIDNITQLKDIMQVEPTDLEKELLRAWEDMKARKMHDYKQKLVHSPPPKLDEGLTKIKQQYESKKMEREIKKERSSRQV